MSIETTPLIIAMIVSVLGGFLSFLSPCVLPLVPGYLGFLTGATLTADAPPPRRVLVVHALAFILGFAVIFTLAGIALGAFVSSLQAGLTYVRWIGGIAVIVLGLQMMGLIQIGVLQRQVRLAPADRLPRGRIVSSFLLGVFFAAGWSPCVGTILSGIFAISASHGARAGLLFFSYAVGLGIPFLLVALAFTRVTPLLRRMNRHLGVVSVASGVFLIAIGLLLLTDGFTRLAALAPPIEPPFLT